MTTSINYKEELGRLFRARRVELGITQNQVALHMNYSSSQFISNFERGVSLLPLLKIMEYAKLLGISTDKVEMLLLFNYKQRLQWAIQSLSKKDSVG